MKWRTAPLVAAAAVACGSDSTSSNGKPNGSDAHVPADHWRAALPAGTDPFADRVVSFEPAGGASFGHDNVPDMVLGRPQGRGDHAGSLDVVSLGETGVIVLALDDLLAVDGDGPDLLVFENPFSDWVESGEVSASEDGITWNTWPCDRSTGHGCAGVHPVYANSDNDLDPTNPEVAGGDAFDLADLGISWARYLRIVDSGSNSYLGAAAGFDLDAIAVVHWRLVE